MVFVAARRKIHGQTHVDVDVRVGQPVGVLVPERDRRDGRVRGEQTALDIVLRLNDANPEYAVGIDVAFTEPDVRLAIAGKQFLVNVKASAGIHRRSVKRAGVVRVDVDVELAELIQIVPDRAVGRREPRQRERLVVVASEARIQQRVIERDLTDGNVQATLVPVE